MKTILIVGALYLDINIQDIDIGAKKEPEQEYVGLTYDYAPGGSSALFAKALVSQGLQPLLIGKIGTDALGKIVKQKLKTHGIAYDLIEDPQVKTNIGINEITTSGQTYMTAVTEASKSLSSIEVKKRITEHLKETSYLYIGGLLKTPQLILTYTELAVEAKSLGVKIVLDHGRAANTVTANEIESVISKLLPLVDYYFPSLKDVQDIWKTTTLEQMFIKIEEVTKAKTILKLGERGAAIFENKSVHYVAPRKVLPAGHLVGAGDTFNAGFIAAIEKGLNTKDATLYANSFAGEKISGKL